MSKYIDLTGQRFGRLTVLRYYKTEKKKVYWLCRCDCGNELAVYGGTLRNGRTKSCGCLASDRMKEYHKRLHWNDGIPELHEKTEEILGETFRYSSSNAVLVANKYGDYYIASYEKSEDFEGWVDQVGDELLKDITNWMALPKPPKEEV